MRLYNLTKDDVRLIDIGNNVAKLILDKRYSELADSFGYALSFDKNPNEAIESEIANCLSSIGLTAKLSNTTIPEVVVKYFKPNDSNFVALVGCILYIENSTRKILVELIAIGDNSCSSISIEEISLID